MNHDDLDQAIDSVAARMTRVEKDDALAGRILAALPDPAPLYWWAPRLAIISVLAVGALIFVLWPFSERSTDVLRAGVTSSSPIEMAAAVPEHRTYVEPPRIAGRTIVEPPSNDPETVVDFERSLPSIAAVGVLNIDSLVAVSLPEDAPLTLKLLAIEELPLTAESVSPR